ncbi:hypothetical protein N7460_004928, partial [Penicillium canescens]
MVEYLEYSLDGEVEMKYMVGTVQQLQQGAIVMRIIVVHTNVSECSKSEAYLDSSKCESDAKGFIRKRQGFHGNCSESIKAMLKEKLAETYGAYTAIMFRFCPD